MTYGYIRVSTDRQDTDNQKLGINEKALKLGLIIDPIVVLLLIIGLPINYIITGRWGYSSKFNFILDWIDKIR